MHTIGQPGPTNMLQVTLYMMKNTYIYIYIYNQIVLFLSHYFLFFYFFILLFFISGISFFSAPYSQVEHSQNSLECLLLRSWPCGEHG
jgi:hypothetical protein